MSVKKLILLLMLVIILLMSVACFDRSKKIADATPDLSEIKAICELATMKCYYHNVAKFKEEDAERFLFWLKDKHFWVEYSGIVEIGIDVSQVSIDVKDTIVTITMPKAKVLRYKVDSKTLNENSFFVAKGSADISAEDQIKAIAEAQNKMVMSASTDSILLANGQQQAQTLLEKYIMNLGDAVGKQYTIKWVYLDSQSGEVEEKTTAGE